MPPREPAPGVVIGRPRRKPGARMPQHGEPARHENEFAAAKGYGAAGGIDRDPPGRPCGILATWSRNLTIALGGHFRSTSVACNDAQSRPDPDAHWRARGSRAAGLSDAASGVVA